ncbi:hypothetical protein DFH28DRAFT_1077851 [Melampsora americana]|nr:hypothetical protein DFH28DRAFT_1077851 [Melampsora americana]
MTSKKKEDSNVLALLGSRPKRARKAVSPPPKKTEIPKIISNAFGIGTSDDINNQPLPNGQYDCEDLNDNPNLAQYLPHPKEPEPKSTKSRIFTGADQFAQDSRAYWNAEDWQQEKLKWAAIESEMTATYLACQHYTNNWTSQTSYLDVNVPCRCPDNELIMQTVDLFDQSTFHEQKEIGSCYLPPTWGPYGRLGQEILFSCMSRPVRLLHHGYIASSTQFPKTAFSIPLVQFHHQLWNKTVVPSTGFVNALFKFLISQSNRTNTNMKRQINQNRILIHQDLRRQFTHSRIYTEGLNHSNAQLLADRCARCFGPAINEKKISPQEPDVIVALDGNFQHRHYTKSSKDNPTEEEFPNIFIKPSCMKKNETIQNLTENQVKNMKVTKWLLRRIRNAQTVSCQARTALTNLSNKRSSFFPTIRYTSDFLRQQWIIERNSQQKRCHIKEEQKLELGRLLYYEDMAQKAWEKDAENTEEAILRLQEHTTYKKKIKKQRAKIGSKVILDGLDAHEQDQILKIWYAKQEVCEQFLAICEQKRPLDISRRDGRNLSIGYNDKTPLLKTLRNQAAKLKTKLESYQKMISTYSIPSPHRSQSPNITYPELLKINVDHSFWNNGLFTNGQDPWAIDTNTQYGMRQIAYFDRASEEIRQIGWEVRRVMRWAIDLHKSLYNLALVQHPALSSLSRPGRIAAAQVIINGKFAQVSHLQVDWNANLLEVFQSTPHQDRDGNLRIDWHNQEDDDIQMDIQGPDEIPRGELGGEVVVNIYDDSDESDGETDMEEEDVYEALNVFSNLSVT